MGEVNIYEMFRGMIQYSDNMPSDFKSDAFDLIKELEQMSAFGTIATMTKVAGPDHVHRPTEVVMYPLDPSRYIERCTLCKLVLDGPFYMDRYGRRTKGV